jgi:hypothetical protein
MAKSSRSHAPRGNACQDALRPVAEKFDAERRCLHSHAEHGNEKSFSINSGNPKIL